MGLNMREINLVGCLFIVFLQVSCNTIFDRNNRCQIDLSMRFVLQSPCNDTPSYIHSLTDLVFLSFDDRGNYLGQSRIDEFSFDKNCYVKLSIYANAYRTYVWSGVSDMFDKATIESEEDIYLLLKSSQFSVISSNLDAVYFGHFQTQDAINDSFNEHFDIYLQEITNRIEIDLEFEGLSEGIDIDDIELTLKSSNGVYYANGNMPSGQDLVTYTPEVFSNANHAIYLYNTLDLKMDQSNSILLKDKTTGNTIYEADLIKSIILKNENINLDCVNDFKLKFVLGSLCDDCDTYTCVKITVNDWLVYSHDIELGKSK